LLSRRDHRDRGCHRTCSCRHQRTATVRRGDVSHQERREAADASDHDPERPEARHRRNQSACDGDHEEHGKDRGRVALDEVHWLVVVPRRSAAVHTSPRLLQVVQTETAWREVSGTRRWDLRGEPSVAGTRRATVRRRRPPPVRAGASTDHHQRARPRLQAPRPPARRSAARARPDGPRHPQARACRGEGLVPGSASRRAECPSRPTPNLAAPPGSSAAATRPRGYRRIPQPKLRSLM
jgi:hypothetical protein